METASAQARPDTWRDPRKLKTQAEIQRHLTLLSQRENELSVALNEIISNRNGLDDSIRRLNTLVPKVKSLQQQVDGEVVPDENERQSVPVFDEFSDDEFEDEDYGLVERIRRVWVTSERVGGKVRKLDVEVSRVKEASERVQEVLELRSALQSLREAIPKGDWELATRCCKRAMDIREEVIESAFSARVIPTSSDPSPPPQALRELRQQLLTTFKREFEEASSKKDEQATSRFFKLFPMIGAENEGLEVYGDFVTGLVRGRNPAGGKPSSPLYYVSHLTSLLESIALIIDQHQNIVDKYYGQGKMKVVVQRLQVEADGFCKTLVEGWEDERRVGRLISETTQSRFDYLANPVQNHVPSNQYGATASVQASLTALSQAQHGLANLPGAATSLLAQYAGAGPKKPLAHTEEVPGEQPDGLEEEKTGPDPRDVDKIIGEMITLSGRWALYRRFVWNRLNSDEDDDKTPMEEKVDPAAIAERKDSLSVDAIDASESQRVITNMLRTYYQPLEAWYLRTSVQKAHRMDTPDLSDRPHVSSVVDDVFYLLKLVLNRALTSGSLATIRAIRENVSKIIERDYLGVLQKKMDAVYSGGGAAIGLLGTNLPGANKEAEKEKREKELRISYSVLLNDLDLSANYTERLVDEMASGGLAEQWFLEVEIPIVRAELKTLTDIATSMRTIAKAGIDQLFNQLTRPRLRTLLEDVYKGVTYLLDEDAYADAENEDVVRKRFIKGWEPLVEGYRASFTDTNFQTFFSMMVEVMVRPWEKMVLGMRFTELGAIRFDRDVRSVANYLSTQTEFGGGREKFTRLQQIATILNLDPDEDPEDFYGSSGIAWRLNKNEYDGIVAIKV